MAHFAKVLNNIVQNVIVAEPEFFDEYVDMSPGEWIQCSYNTVGGVHYVNGDFNVQSEDQSKALRKNFPAKGFSYSKELDAFIPPKPFDSWVLNEDTCLWVAPIDKPADGEHYIWNEENQQWIIKEAE